jgi:hypothetical protein
VADPGRPRGPALNDLVYPPLPDDRPPGLTLTVQTWRLFRIDVTPFASWSWAAFPGPRYRFDSIAGLHRVRYAASTEAGAARERYRDMGGWVPAGHADHYWTELTGELALLDLRRNEILDALGIDARISTGYEDHVRATCRLLTDRAHDWWGDEVHGFAYASRTTPETSTNVALFARAPLVGTSTPLADCTEVLEHLILTGGIQVDFTF